MRLPNFELDEYLQVVTGLRELGYSTLPVSAMRTWGREAAVFLRHDVDFDLTAAEPMARAEASIGSRSTYYILLTQYYNPMQAESRATLRRIVELGHEIGLHYDMETYPSDPVQAREHLEWEVGVLTDVAGSPVETIVMHQPSKGAEDPFQTLDEYLHPHDPRLSEELLYVSDSCRAWRDTRLLACWGVRPPPGLLLNTHPELWLDGSVTDRMAYLELLRQRVTANYGRFIETRVRDSWLFHPGTRLHDERVDMERNS